MSKLEDLTHYICWKCEDPTKLGATKLNKILWFSDVRHYVLTGKPITEATYRKLPRGPVPDRIDRVKKKLHDDKKISVSKGLHFNKPQERLIALERPSFASFTSEQISLVDEVADTICHNHTATSISEFTHQTFWWDKLPVGSEMPLYAVYADPGEITTEQLSWANSQLNRLKRAA